MIIFAVKLDSMAGITQHFKLRRIAYPLIIGLGIAFWIVYKNYDQDLFGFFVWTRTAFLGLLLAMLMMVIRDWAYMYRLRVLTNQHLSWKQAFQVIMLWEFSSAVSPSMVGGTAPAIYFLYKEGINTGKSTAVVLVAIFLDELFFIIMVPLMYLIFGNKVFPSENLVVLSSGLNVILVIGYLAIFVYTLALAYALFINPHAFKWLLSWIFLIPFLRPWRMKMRKLANQLIMTSNEMKGKTFGYWVKAFLATVFSWTARYWVVNFIFIAFFFDHLGLFEHFLVYARQLTMWIILLISPTPGGSGMAELVFEGFLGDLLPNLAWALPLAVLWRFFSYYPYLLMGVLVMPSWVRRVYKKSSDSLAIE